MPRSGKWKRIRYKKLFEYQKGRCIYCDCEMNKLATPENNPRYGTFEHIFTTKERISIDKKMGYESVVLACSKCNKLRDNIPIIDWLTHISNHDRDVNFLLRKIQKTINSHIKFTSDVKTRITNLSYSSGIKFNFTDLTLEEIEQKLSMLEEFYGSSIEKSLPHDLRKVIKYKF